MKKFCGLIVFLLISLVVEAQSVVTQVEGIFYQDESPVRVEMLDGKITRITRIAELSEKSEKLYIGPGLIDNQVNGYYGVSFIDMGEELTMEGIYKATKALWKDGVTTYLPTLTTNKKEIYLKNLSLLAKAKDDPGIRGSIPGFHIEGPYISPVDGYRGAHPLISVRKPDWEEFMEFYEASEGNILQITVAPEVEGAMDFISKLNEKGIVVAIGHHNASVDQIREAIDRGAKMSTHLGNGMANSINRHRNPLWHNYLKTDLWLVLLQMVFTFNPNNSRFFIELKEWKIRSLPQM